MAGGQGGFSRKTLTYRFVLFAPLREIPTPQSTLAAGEKV